MMKKNSERNAAIRFMKKLFILFIPFIALLAVYFLDDPFMVLKNYERYDQTPVVLNEGHVGWQMYLNNRDTIPIDSYIMGNSCTMAYQCHEWEKYLHGGRAVRLFGNAESLAAVCLKLKALDKAGATIKNLLLIIRQGIIAQRPLPDRTFQHSATRHIGNKQLQVSEGILPSLLLPELSLPLSGLQAVPYLSPLHERGYKPLWLHPKPGNQ